MIEEKLQKIKKGELSAEKNIKEFLSRIKKDENNIVLYVNDRALEEAKEVDKKIKKGNAGKLAGLGVLIKSNISVLGLPVTCASETLKNYKGSYDATVIEKLKKEDAIILGMVNMDEFACGSSGETSAFGACKNPVCDRVPGGSSSGSAAGVAADLCDFALGSDTGGSIRNPASNCGVIGFKPSYGMVSRYGLIDLSMSLDQIGPLAKCVEDAKIVFEVIKGRDEKDSISLNYDSKRDNLRKVNIGVPEIQADEQIWELIKRKVEQVSKKGIKASDLEMPYLEWGVQTYYPVNYVEFYSGTRRFDGRKYGKKIEEGCGEEVLRRILGGKEISKAEYKGKYYRKALKAKKLIEKEFEKAFKKYDFIVLPIVPKLPHKLGEKVSVEQMYDYDALTVLASLAEIPAISVPCGKIGDVPVGLQILGRKGEDSRLLEFTKEFEE